MAMPIIRDGKVEGVIAAGLNVEWLGQQLQQRGVQSGGAILIADRNGIVVSREPDRENSSAENSTTALAGSADRSPEARRSSALMAFIALSATSRLPHAVRTYVSSGISRTEALAPIDRAVRNSIALFALGSAIAFLLAWLVGESIIRRPLMRMVATAEAWRRGMMPPAPALSGVMMKSASSARPSTG
jgi:C4-dicarboxylate-specific signal transduction histidine kinase